MNAATPLPMPSSRGRNREIWVGVFVLAGIAAVLFVLFTLTSPATFRGRYYVTARVPDAGGIRRGDPVQLRGVNIGRVKGFELQPGWVAIQLEIERDFPIPADSRIELRSNSLLGEMAAEVIPGSSRQAAHANQMLPGSVGAAPFSKVNDLASEAAGTFERVQKLLNDQTLGNIQSSSAQLDTALKELAALAAEERTGLRGLTESLRRSAQGLEGAVAGPQLERSVQRLDTLTARLDTMSASLARTAHSAEMVMGRIQQGEGSLGLLTNDDSLYVNASSAVANLNRAAQEITALTSDIRREPKKYLKISVF